MQLTTLPNGDAAKLSVVLHADLDGRPYKIGDFKQPLQQVRVLSYMTGLGAYRMSYVWLLKLKTPEAKAKLLKAMSLQVKGLTCQLVDPNRRDPIEKGQYELGLLEILYSNEVDGNQ